jgi:hypothetical protein
MMSEDKYYVIVSYPHDGAEIYSFNTLEEARESYKDESDTITRAIINGHCLQKTDESFAPVNQ